MKLPTGKHPLRQHREEDVVGHQAGHGDRPPAGSRLEDRVQPLDVGNARVRQLQKVDAVEERRNHAGAEQLDLAGEQQVPHRMVVVGEGFPALRDDIVRPVSGRAGRPW